MMQKYSFLALAAALTIGPTTEAVAGDPYVGFDVIGARSIVDFGGFNTLGPHFNRDDEAEYTTGVALKFGLQDQFSLGSITITPEAEFAWYNDYDTVSASFPGLPAPTFLYNSSIESGRLELNLWAALHDDDKWRAEAGVGFGAMYRDVTTNDTIVRGTKNEYVPYGRLGVRVMRKLGDRSAITFGAAYLFSDSTSVPLNQIVGGAPAGNLSVETNHAEITIGYQLKLGN